ncbi:MAG: hypothetical protein R3236_11770, partial [Phycisphaeraceae bacterium]|nr:hypothetical protein [Phycisphaeraceae bacterium]
MNRPTEKTFDATAMCYLDGQATEAQTRHLFRWLAEDPKLQNRYVRLAYQHGLMCELMQPRELAPAHETTEDHAAATLGRTRRLTRPTPWYRQPAKLAAVLLGAMLIGAMAMLSQWAHRIHEPAALPVVATVIETDEAIWAGDLQPTIGDDLHPDQRLALAAGRVTIRYASGVQMRIEGPAYLKLRDPMRTDLERGWVLTEVPAEARGF